jgi:hypothetical protein
LLATYTTARICQSIIKPAWTATCKLHSQHDGIRVVALDAPLDNSVSRCTHAPLDKLPCMQLHRSLLVPLARYRLNIFSSRKLDILGSVPFLPFGKSEDLQQVDAYWTRGGPHGCTRA